MHILILGGSGFIGKHLINYFLTKGHNVIVTSRKSMGNTTTHANLAHWDGQDKDTLIPLLEDANVVINLVGANIAASRWSHAQKHLILQSRTLSCKTLKDALKILHTNGKCIPKIIIQASGCGYYGLFDDVQNAPICTENSPKGEGFLADVCAAWEDEKNIIASLGVRHCTVRIAPVLGNEFNTHKAGGFLASMLTPFHFYLGGPLGSGKQPLPWIHMQDLVESIDFLIQNQEAAGIFNLCAPKTTSMNEFVQALAKAMHRPAFFRVPAPLLSLALGQMAKELILSGQNVIPKGLTELGFNFNYADIYTALKECIK